MPADHAKTEKDLPVVMVQSFGPVLHRCVAVLSKAEFNYRILCIKHLTSSEL